MAHLANVFQNFPILSFLKTTLFQISSHHERLLFVEQYIHNQKQALTSFAETEPAFYDHGWETKFAIKKFLLKLCQHIRRAILLDMEHSSDNCFSRIVD